MRNDQHDREASWSQATAISASRIPKNARQKNGITTSSGEAARASSQDRLNVYAISDNPARLTSSRQTNSKLAK